MDSLPPGQLLFVLWAASDTLQTPPEPLQVEISNRFEVPTISPTVLHILNVCPASLCQRSLHGAMTVFCLHWLIVPVGVKIYADLPGWRACNNPPGTIPAEFVATSARLDIVVVRGYIIQHLELTVPFNSPESLKNAQSKKNAKVNYQLVLSECDRKGGILH